MLLLGILLFLGFIRKSSNKEKGNKEQINNQKIHKGRFNKEKVNNKKAKNVEGREEIPDFEEDFRQLLVDLSNSEEFKFKIPSSDHPSQIHFYLLQNIPSHVFYIVQVDPLLFYSNRFGMEFSLIVGSYRGLKVYSPCRIKGCQNTTVICDQLRKSFKIEPIVVTMETEVKGEINVGFYLQNLGKKGELIQTKNGFIYKTEDGDYLQKQKLLENGTGNVNASQGDVKVVEQNQIIIRKRKHRRGFRRLFHHFRRHH